MKIQHLLLAGTIALSGCASITAIPLDENGARKDGAVEGLRYYMGKPYLLITELPQTATPPSNNNGGGGGSGHSGGSTGGSSGGSNGGSSSGGSSGGGSSGGGSSGGGSNGGGSGSGASAAAAPTAGSSDTSFTASIASYQVKLIYLPDFSQPMALQATGGLFGTANLSPTLQDGWMLTGLSGSVDSGGSNIVTLAGDGLSLISGKPTGGGGGGGGDSGSNKALAVTAANGSQITIPLAVWGAGVLQPGLYGFTYANGLVTSVYPVTLFCGDGVVLPVNKPDRNGKIPSPGPATCNSARP